MKWKIEAQTEEGTADIFINDFIGDWIDGFFGFGVTSKQFIKDLQDLPESVKNIRIHVNSPGGDVVAANHIANTIRDQRANMGRNFEVLIEGAAWSAATIITSAGQPTKIADNALMMIHDPWMIALGSASELREQAAILDKFRDTIVTAYRWKSPLSEKELIELMETETWMDADEAIENGFADEKIEGLNIAACFDPNQLEKLPKRMRDIEAVPEKYRERVQAMFKGKDDGGQKTDYGDGEGRKADSEKFRNSQSDIRNSPPPDPEQIRKEAEARAREILSLCNQAGVPELADQFLEKGTSVDEVKARFADVDKIRAKCAATGKTLGHDAQTISKRAATYIKAGKTLQEVTDELLTMMINHDPARIVNKLGPEDGFTRTNGKQTINPAEIYALRSKGAGTRQK